MKTATELLPYAKQAWGFIDDKSKWATGCMARNANGYSTHTDEEDACRFCSHGALVKLAPPYEKGEDYFDGVEGSIYQRLLVAAGLDPERDNVGRWNDTSDYETVKAVWLKMIATLEAEASLEPA